MLVMRSICARRTDLCPAGARFERVDARLLTSRVITTFFPVEWVFVVGLNGFAVAVV